jgi:hypothetical protein
MALDPMIARGVQPVDISNTLAQVAALRQRDQGLQQSAQQNAFVQQKYQDEQDQDDEEDLMFADLTAKAQQAYDQGGEEAALPLLMQASRIDPHSAGLLAQSMRAQTEAKKKAAPIEEQRLPGSGRYLATQGGNPVGSPWAPPEQNAPQKPGYGAPQPGMNPQTGKPDQYVVDDNGGVKWLGVQPVEQGPKPIDVAKTRKEFRALPSVKDYETALPLLVSARKAPDNGYGDLQLIYTAGKILDPGSVVREGELALTVAAGSPLQRIIGQTRFTTENGGRLTKETRKQLLGMLNERVLAYRQGYDRDYQQYAEYASAANMTPRDVVGRHAANAYQDNKAPAGEGRVQKTEAPASALEYLSAHPETKAAFFKKYGYLPRGK